MKETRLQTLPHDLNLNILLFLTFSELITFRCTSNEIKNWNLSKILNSVTIKISPTVQDHMDHYFRLSSYRASLQFNMEMKLSPWASKQLIHLPIPTLTVPERKTIPIEIIIKQCSQSIMPLLAKKIDAEKSKKETRDDCLIM